MSFRVGASEWGDPRGLIALGALLVYQNIENHLIQPVVIGKAKLLMMSGRVLDGEARGSAATHRVAHHVGLAEARDQPLLLRPVSFTAPALTTTQVAARHTSRCTRSSPRAEGPSQRRLRDNPATSREVAKSSHTPGVRDVSEKCQS